MTSFAERLHELVKTSGMTQRDFAELMGVAVSAQRNYEKGLRKPDTDYLCKLHDAGYDLHYLLTGERNVSTLSPDESKLLAAWRKAKDVNREIALVVLNMHQQALKSGDGHD